MVKYAAKYIFVDVSSLADLSHRGSLKPFPTAKIDSEHIQ